MAKVSVKSSTVSTIDYDSKTRELTVEFLNGGRYVYEAVPESVYNDFVKAESAGQFVAKNLKNKFKTRSLTA